MSETNRSELSKKAADLVGTAYRNGWADGIGHITGAASKGTTAMKLLERFVDLYGEVPLAGSMIGPGSLLWRNYYEFKGDHMILTDEGWEPGDVKQAYLDEYGADSILAEVNAPKLEAKSE